ncbi:DsbA family protein [Mesorhizobium sp. M00.F.Ca.ET.186.01.1.1]|nr:DsbA family protein [bacterium M00.F.Ca.ET.205.01.1.1]TGU47353.1 DsbA family protein [bacterium M00.F.Ca.ET.152.01.1.1]TGV31841.1 DsbA family protein [Mesorhizobium sp. M00.F.Ca.ET.186.01.1.1]TGZ39132.1 DsbA family protein [bacterium M00.F.Ca.ET.162.01.1.1]
MNRPPFGKSLSRRNVLSSLAAIPAVALLAACSDSGEQAKAADVKPADPATPAKPATPATPAAAAKVPEAQGSVDVAELMKPGALPDKQLGKDDAKVTIVEYASMTCPHCAHFAETTFPELKTKYIDTGKARYILREFPFDPSAEAGFMLARCSKDNYFPMVDVLFRQQANWVGVQNTKDALLQISKLAGFTQESFEACLTDQKLLDDVRSVQKRGANEFKVDSTPTFFINGKTYKGAMSIEEMSAIIDPLL